MKKRAWNGVGAIVFVAFFAFPIGASLIEEKWPADIGPKIKGHIEALVKNGTRKAGTPNEEQAARYIADELEAMGIPAVIESFSYESFDPDRIDLKIGRESFAPLGLGLDPYGRGLSYSGPFVLLDPRTTSTWPSADVVAGKAVVTSDVGDPSLHFRIAALQPRFIIVLSANDFGRAKNAADPFLALSIHGGLVNGNSRNVIARLGPNPPAPQILLGAHLDAFGDCPGANDNASGIAALLETARFMRSGGIPKGIGLTIVAFGAEEAGVLGSRQYVEFHARELRYCSLAFVFDDLGGDGPVHIERNGGLSLVPPEPGAGRIPAAYRGRAWSGLRFPWSLLPPPAFFEFLGTGYHPEWLKAAIDEAIRELDFQVRTSEIQGSDQISFAQAGIATSGISAVNGRGHTMEDRPETVNIERVKQAAAAAVLIVQKIGTRLNPDSAESPVRKSDDKIGPLIPFLARFLVLCSRCAGNLPPSSSGEDHSLQGAFSSKRSAALADIPAKKE